MALLVSLGSESSTHGTSLPQGFVELRGTATGWGDVPRCSGEQRGKKIKLSLSELENGCLPP